MQLKDTGSDTGSTDTGVADAGSDVDADDGAFNPCPGQLLCLVGQPYCFAICENAQPDGGCPYVDPTTCFGDGSTE